MDCTLLCPNTLLMVYRSTPRPSKMLAHEWRRSWKFKCGMPAVTRGRHYADFIPSTVSAPGVHLTSEGPVIGHSYAVSSLHFRIEKFNHLKIELVD